MFQALAQYQIDIPNAVILDMDVSIHLPKRGPLNFHFNVDNAGLAHSTEVRVTGFRTLVLNGPELPA